MQRAGRQSTFLILIAFGVLLVGGSVTAADPAAPVLRAGANVGKELNEAQRLISTGKPAEAADKLRNLIEEYGHELVTADGHLYRPLSVLAQPVLFNLPKEELQAYQKRIDIPAAKLFEQGLATRDPRPLLQIVERYLAASVAEDALWLLGHIAYERGEYHTARRHWQRLLIGEPGPGVEFTLPNVRLPQALVHAHVLQARLLDGERETLRAELDAFRLKHPDAHGELFGAEGKLAELIQQRLEIPPAKPVPTLGMGTWTTLGGNELRNGLALGRLPRNWPNQPSWEAQLTIPQGVAQPFEKPISARGAAIHPVVWQGMAIAATAYTINAYDLRTGLPRFRYRYRDQEEFWLRSAKTVSNKNDADFCLTVAADRLFARMGPLPIPPSSNQAEFSDRQPSAIVAFGLTHEAAEKPPLRELWRLTPPVAQGVNASWEAAPIVHRGRLYAAFTMEAKGGITQAIACYPITDDLPGSPYWVYEAADLPASQNLEPRYRAEPLTIAGDQVVLCTHSGAIVAVNSQTGKPSWGFSYPKATKMAPVLRDVNPPVADGGRLFIAPNDSNLLLALDATTGEKLWHAEGIQVDQILGVTNGKVVAAIAAPTRGLRAFDMRTGSDRHPHGWAIHDDPWLSSYGRGLVTYQAVYWPTKQGIFTVRATDGLPLPGRILNVTGNLAFADDVLLIGTAGGLAAFVPKAMQPLSEPKEQFVSVLGRAELAARNGQREQAKALLVALLRSSQGVHAAHQAQAAAMLAKLFPNTSEGYQKYTTIVPQVKRLGEEFLACEQGLPVRLKHFLASYFHLPIDVPLPISNPLPSKTTTQASPPERFGLITLSQEQAWPLQIVGPVPTAWRSLHPFVDREQLLFVDLSTGKVIHKAGLPPERIFTACLFSEQAAYLFGPDCISKWEWNTEQISWCCDWPDPDLQTAITANGLPSLRSEFSSGADGGFSHPCLAGPLLIVHRGGCLLAIETTSGEYAWLSRPTREGTSRWHRQQYAPTLSEHSPRWAVPYLATERYLLVHNSVNELCVLDTRSGAPLATFPSSHSPWQSPPVFLSHSACLAPAGPSSDDRLLSLIQLPTGTKPPTERRLEQHTGETSLVGNAPLLLAGPNAALAFVPRNIGHEVLFIQESLFDGKNRLKRGRLIPHMKLDFDCATTDAQRAYVPINGELWVFDWTNGQLVYEPVVLGRAETKFNAQSAGAVIICTAKATPAIPKQRLNFCTWMHPLGWLAAYDAFADNMLALVVVEAQTGAVRQRLEVPVNCYSVVRTGENFAAILSKGQLVLVKLQ